MPRPLKFRLYHTKSTKESFRRLIVSAEKRKTKRRGNIFAEKVLRYLVSANLSLIIPQEALPQGHGRPEARGRTEGKNPRGDRPAGGEPAEPRERRDAGGPGGRPPGAGGG